MGLMASRGIEYEDSYRSFSEKERQLLSSLFDKLATKNEHGVMKIELEPFKVSCKFSFGVNKTYTGSRGLSNSVRGDALSGKLLRIESIFGVRNLYLKRGKV